MTSTALTANQAPGPYPSDGVLDPNVVTSGPEAPLGLIETGRDGPGAEVGGAGGAKVMIVDDASMTLRLLQAFLEDAGYTRFVTTDRSTEAMSLLLAERPDVVLLDLNMPEVSGFDILSEARAHPDVEHVPIIILTASEDSADKLRALELGATDFLAKPVDTSELALRLRNTLAAKAHQDRLAYYDALTNLPNRGMFLDRLADSLARARRSGEPGAVLHINLDRFRHLNDSLGHGVGDRILRTVARRIAGSLRDADEVCRAPIVGPRVSTSRLGGDEFVVLLPCARDRDSAGIVATRIVKVVSAPIPLDDGELIVTPSIGTLMFPEQADSVEMVLTKAALATARAKQLGRGRYEPYSHRCEADSAEQPGLESDLHRALARDELRLHFQPKVDVATGRVVGAEALLRWEHPERGQVSPGEFIPLAEETGLIVPIGSWVLHAACEQVARWRDTGLGDLGVAVNVASLQLKDGSLPSVVRTALDRAGIDAAQLTLELTESGVIESGKESIDTLSAIRSLGVRLSLDDFGTGYSSLSYLERLPIDELKIDRSFIARIDAEGDEAPIVSAVIAMARRLGLQVVAEGVENDAQRDYLGRHRCDLYQGFLFARPMLSDDFAERVRVAAEESALQVAAAAVLDADKSCPGPIADRALDCAKSRLFMAQSELPGRRAEVLLIEDEPMVCNLIGTLLEEDGIVVTAAYTGGAGVALARRRRFDLVLLDVDLPDVDGFSVCTTLRTDAATDAVPVIFLAARETREDEARGLNAGAVDFIRKPVHADILRMRVRNHLALRMQRDQLLRMGGVDGSTGP